MNSHFAKHLLNAGILDPVGTHHEFAYGLHGRKLDFDLIKDDSWLYKEWVEASVSKLKRTYQPVLPGALLGVANGTNRLARDVANSLGLAALYTQKITLKTVALTAESVQELTNLDNKFVIILEDVGTSGGTALTAAESALHHGATKTEVQFSWQRNQDLSAFLNTTIPYHALIQETLPSFTTEQCRAKGYCSMNWKLIPR